MKLLSFKKRSSARVTIVESRPLPSLALCVVLDLVGYASFAVPVLGEVLDIAWAPLSAAIYMKLFGFRKGFMGGMFQFMEEILPGMDIIPTFTITWFLQNAKRNKQTFAVRPFTR